MSLVGGEKSGVKLSGFTEKSPIGELILPGEGQLAYSAGSGFGSELVLWKKDRGLFSGKRG